MWILIRIQGVNFNADPDPKHWLLVLFSHCFATPSIVHLSGTKCVTDPALRIQNEGSGIRPYPLSLTSEIIHTKLIKWKNKPVEKITNLSQSASVVHYLHLDVNYTARADIYAYIDCYSVHWSSKFSMKIYSLCRKYIMFRYYLFCHSFSYFDETSCLTEILTLFALGIVLLSYVYHNYSRTCNWNVHDWKIQISF